MKTHWRYAAVLFVIFSAPFPSIAYSADYCVTSSVELQNALSIAATTIDSDRILIRTGSYAGNFSYVTVAPDNNISLLGGYGADCLTRETTDASSTILDGQFSGVTLVISSGGGDINIEIDGVTVKNGLRRVDDGVILNAAGLYLNTRGSVTLNNIVVQNNVTQRGSGGGAYIEFVTNLRLLNSNILGNHSTTAGGGLAVMCRDLLGKVEIVNSTFSDNSSNTEGGGVYVISCSDLIVDSSHFTGNYTAGDGGGAIRGGAKHIQVSRNDFISNRASGRGGAAILSSTSNTGAVEFNNNLVLGNSSNYVGGGAFFYSGLGQTLSITNNTIVNNIAANSAGGIGIWLESEVDPAYVNNNIIYGNKAPKSSDLGVDNDLDLDFIPSQIEIKNNNLNTSSTGFSATISIALDASNLNNINPNFVNSGAGDFHLRIGSALIDAGSNSAINLPLTDKDGEARSQGSAVDIGAYEGGDDVWDLSLQISADSGPILPATQTTYLLQVTNLGTATANSPEVVISLPTDSEFVSGSLGAGTCVQIGATINCIESAIAAGGSIEGELILQFSRSGLFEIVANAHASETEVDLKNNSASATTTVNTPPKAFDSAITTQINIVTGQLSAEDKDSDALKYSITSTPMFGSVVITNINTGIFKYTAPLGTTGTVSFSFTASDSVSTSNTGIVTINIEATPSSIDPSSDTGNGDPGNQSNGKTGGGGTLGVLSLFALAVLIGLCRRQHRRFFVAG